MSTTGAPPSLSDGLSALADAEWERARELLVPVVEAAPAGAALEALGTAYFWLDHPETIDIRESAYRHYRAEGDARGAARVAIGLVLDYISFRGETAVAQGWLELAGRALEGQPMSPEHGQLAAWAADFAIGTGDPEEALRRAIEAIEIGRRLGTADIELIGLAQKGYLLVADGQIAEGMRLLDASAAAAVAGEFEDPALAGYACCYVITASSNVLDLPRATQWCERLDAHCQKVGFHSLRHLCQVEYAGVLVETGDWSRAEAEILTAAENLGARRPAMAGEATVRLAELRRRQGRTDEAARLFAEMEGHPRAMLGEAGLALDTGDPTTATRLAERYLRQIAPDDRISRAEALRLLVLACCAAGDVPAARLQLEDLRATLASAGPGPLRAGLLLAEATLLLAENAPEPARAAAEDAMAMYDRAGTPFGAAHARFVLARILMETGDVEGARREASAATTAFDHLGAAGDAALARAVVPDARPATGLLSAREVEVLRLVASGLSNAEVAARLVLSEHTVHRHVANALTKLDVRTRAAAVARATALGQL